MKQVLIYLHKKRLAPIGGHFGYNYNFNCQLEKKGIKNIHFIETDIGDREGVKNWINKIPFKWLRYLVTILKSIVRKGFLMYGFNNNSIVDLSKYDIVHFQSTFWMYSCRNDLRNYKGKVVLTSHSPTLLSMEIFDKLTPFEKKYMKWFYKHLIDMDVYAFNRADYIVFPCEEAMDPYYNAWPEFSKIKERRGDRFRYMLSGIEPCIAKENRSDVRVRYNIPEDSFVICYVGRHHEIKGYDTLKNIGSVMLEDQNTYILVAGKEEPLKGLKHNRWIEIGWTNDPHSIIAASDVFVLPNKETYFDLVMLEVLSLGKIVVASNTGGNRFFNKVRPNGIFLYNTVKECIETLKKIREMDIKEINRLGQLNKELYQEYFTASSMADNYINLVESLN